MAIYTPGKKIIKAVNLFDGSRLKEIDNGYELREKNYRVEIQLAPPKWIGLEFYWHEGEKDELGYQINTDLYDLSESRNELFANEIEDQIVDFLEILKEGRLLVGVKKHKEALIIPFKDDPVLLKRGRFWPRYSAKTFKSIDDAKAGGSYKLFNNYHSVGRN